VAHVARSSASKSNSNKLRYHKIKVFLQRFPGKMGTDADRAVSDTPEYKIYISGTFSQSGNVAADGSIEIMMPSGTKAEIETLGTKYEVEALISVEPFDTLLGVQRRLQLLGYYEGPVDEKWGARTDAAVLDFQADNGLDPNGYALEQATMDKIKSIFGE
jgi:hypothetical protein